MRWLPPDHATADHATGTPNWYIPPLAGLPRAVPTAPPFGGYIVPLGSRAPSSSSSNSSSMAKHHEACSLPGSAPHSGQGSTSASAALTARFRSRASSKRRCRPFFTHDSQTETCRNNRKLTSIRAFGAPGRSGHPGVEVPGAQKVGAHAGAGGLLTWPYGRRARRRRNAQPLPGKSPRRTPARAPSH
jgi:hypothetical protein